MKTAKEWSKQLLFGGGDYVEAQHEKTIADALAEQREAIASELRKQALAYARMFQPTNQLDLAIDIVEKFGTKDARA